MEGNCLYGCKHYKTESIAVKKDIGNGMSVVESNRYVHRCDKCPHVYEKWWSENKTKTLENAEKLECYEPNEIQATLNDMISIAENILNKTRK